MPLDLAYGRRLYDWWGRHASVYRAADWITFLGRESRIRRAAIERIELQPGSTVLDLACGPGVNFGFLEQRIGPSGRLIGFDYSAAMLQAARDHARREGWGNVELIQGDAAHMDLPEGSLDGALCTLGLSAMPEHAVAVRNVQRALRAGRRFVVVDAGVFPRGPWRLLNPLIRVVYRYLANWDRRKDIPATLRTTFDTVAVDERNAGSVFIATAEQRMRR